MQLLQKIVSIFMAPVIVMSDTNKYNILILKSQRLYVVEIWEKKDPEWSYLETKAILRVKGGQNQTGERSLRTTTEEIEGTTRFPNPKTQLQL